MGSLPRRLAAHFPVDNKNPAALPHARLALETLCFDETTALPLQSQTQLPAPIQPAQV